jgi:hypothetical protein
MLRAALQQRVASAAPDFWASKTILLKAEGPNARLIAHNQGELGVLSFRQVYSSPVTIEGALQLLASNGYQLKEKGVTTQAEGVVDAYVKVSREFTWSAGTIFVKNEGGVTRLVIPAEKNAGMRQVHADAYNPRSAHEVLSRQGFKIRERFFEDGVEGSVDVYQKALPGATPADPTFDWTGVSSVCVKQTSNCFKLVVPPRQRQEHPQNFSEATAHAALVSRGFRLKERFTEVPEEGLCDYYERAC